MQTLQLKDKDVVVLGLGRSGMAAASLLRRGGARVVVRDEADGGVLEERADRLRQLGVRVELGCRFDHAQQFDLAVLSPGIAPGRPIVKALGRQTPVLSELELAYRHCICPIVAITGTNGKTTTTELIEATLNHCGQRAVAAGNIGFAFSEAVAGSAGLDALVVEVSSFQLERIEQFRPHVAVLLNITPDHLDRYDSMDDYARAKSRIFLNQTAEDFAVISAESLAEMRRLGVPLRARTITFSVFGHDADLWLDQDTIWCRLPECRGIALRMDETNLRGRHNAENIMATLATGLALGLTVTEMREAIAGYCPQPHRCEFVAQRNGVTFINDSKATNVDAVAKALQSLAAPVVLIAGGRDKALDFTALREVIAEKVKVAVLLGETAGKMAQAWADVVPCELVSSMADAVRTAAKYAVPGDVVLLSPACASFDMFQNYEHRGEEFKRSVFALS
jgi:UDP-N-acetylmuramoylalanine--D-glutamate ligase